MLVLNDNGDIHHLEYFANRSGSFPSPGLFLYGRETHTVLFGSGNLTRSTQYETDNKILTRTLPLVQNIVRALKPEDVTGQNWKG